MSYPIALLPIVITGVNKRIIFKEGAGAAGNVDLTHGTYFLRGAGSDDIMAHIATKFGSFGGGGNTYTGSVAWSADPDAPTATATFTRASGSDTFQILWGNAGTTFDWAALGLNGANTANTSAAKSSTLSPSSAWVCDSAYEDYDPIDDVDGYVLRANSGVVRSGIIGGPYDVRRLALGMVAGKRVHHSLNTGDPDAAFSMFLRRWKAGRAAELHFRDPSTYPALTAIAAAADRWHIGEGSQERFAARKLDRATSLWSWDLELWKYVA
jgi:hypothetical protein